MEKSKAQKLLDVIRDFEITPDVTHKELITIEEYCDELRYEARGERERRMEEMALAIVGKANGDPEKLVRLSEQQTCK